MVEPSIAKFSFQNYKVSRFTYDDTYHTDGDLRVGFSPSGKYILSKGIFELELKVLIHQKEDPNKIISEIVSLATFHFDTPVQFNEIPQYFYKNSIAIFFPYIRAFVSTLTLQANNKLLRLGLMNLSGLEVPLKENTKVVE